MFILVNIVRRRRCVAAVKESEIWKKRWMTFAAILVTKKAVV